MKREAEANAESDKARREVVDAKNQAEQICHEVEKQLEENGDKLEASDKSDIETAVAELKSAAEAGDKAKIDEAMNNLQQKAVKLAEVAQAAGAGAGGDCDGAGNCDEGECADGACSDTDDEAVDADFEVKS